MKKIYQKIKTLYKSFKDDFKYHLRKRHYVNKINEKSLSETDKRKVSLLNFLSKYKFHRIYKCRYKDETYRNHFWWTCIYGQIYVKHWRNVLPKSISAISKLQPIKHDASDYGLIYNDINNISSNNILYLEKKYKKWYIKPKILTESARYIIACLSGTDIKYIFYGKNDDPEKDIKFYQKEIKALEDAGLKLIDINVKTSISLKTEYRRWNPETKETTEHTDYITHNCSGYLFELPVISEKEAMKIYAEIRDKRLKELHITK